MAVSRHIVKRLEDKKADYTSYGFSRVESNALKTYFDLAQEFDTLEDVYQVSVAIPKSFFDLNARLYVVDPSRNRLALVASSQDGIDALGRAYPHYAKAARRPYCVDHAMILTIRGKKQWMKQLPFEPQDNVIGVLEVYPYEGNDRHQELFFEKYANRIGYSLHMRFLLQKNMEHVKFIQGLVTDIEHNVIVPNMIYKLFLRRLGGKISKNREIEQSLKKVTAGSEIGTNAEVEALLAELREVNRGLDGAFANIEKHYESSSLFLETLLRKSHFDEGHLTLRTKACNMKHDVIAPQLERLAGRFAEKGIDIVDAYGDSSEDKTIAVVDVGLMAQVYGNLFSNALKYTKEVQTQQGDVKKYISYGQQSLKDYFGPGKNGVKYNVFSTGSRIPDEESQKIFKEGFRGAGSSNRPGTGHGLAFVKNAVEIHGGITGCETVVNGNNFYFIIPE